MTAFFTLRSKHSPPSTALRMDEAFPASALMKIRGIACIHPIEDGRFVLAFSMLGNVDQFDPKRGRTICEGRARFRAESINDSTKLRRAVADYTEIFDTFQQCKDMIHIVKKAANDTISGMQYASVVRDIIHASVPSVSTPSV